MSRRWFPALAGVVFAALAASSALGYQLKAPNGGAIHALVVGINAYPNLNNKNLRGAVNDARGIADALTGGGVRDLKLLINEDATRASFVAAMDRLVAISKPGDLVFISYAGHGLRVREYDRWRGLDPGGANEEIALSGYGSASPHSGEVVVNVETRAWLARLDAKKVDVIVVWDSCFGGGMRDLAPGGGAASVRQLVRDAPDGEIFKTFQGIATTSLEERADIKTMEHVTFLAGADSFTTVPELTGVDREHPEAFHGALSYYVSQALYGRLTKGAISRRALFNDIRQTVREASQRQSLELTPQSESDAAVSNRNVIIVDDVAAAPAAAPDAVRVAVVDGPADAFDSVTKGQTPIALAQNPDTADLVWNVPKRQAIAHHDVLMSNVDGSMIGAIADRIAALTRLRALGESRTLSVKVGQDGTAFVAPDSAPASVEGLAGANLVVFNVTADALVEMLLPAAPSAPGQCPDADQASWECPLGVTPPYGIDTVVAIATKQSPGPLLDWLRQHHDRRAAAELPRLIEALAHDDKSLRLGFAEVVTAATK